MKQLLPLIFAIVMCANLNAQSYDQISQQMFVERSVEGVRSTPDGEHFTTLKDGRIIKYSYKTGEQVSVMFDMPDFRPIYYQFSADQSKLLLVKESTPIYRYSFSAEYWVYDLPTKSLKQLSSHGAQRVATFSPDGARCAFVRDNNLFVVELDGMRERQITTDGVANHIINGVPDWVYEEEFSFTQAYQWSPGSYYIAFYRFDESQVREFEMTVFNGELYPRTVKYKYPKAGEKNSIVTLHLYNIASGSTQKVDTGEESDQYIPRITWTPSGDFAFFRLNRAQNFYELIVTNPQTNAQKVVYSEKDERYIERIDDQTVTFIGDGSRFLITSEKSGFNHIYLCDISTGDLKAVTSGNWDVTQVLGYDPKADVVYYMSCEESPTQRNMYRIKLSGKSKTRMTPNDGTNRIDFSSSFNYYISYFSHSRTPLTVTLHNREGKLLRMLEYNEELKNKLHENPIPHKEFFTLTTSEGIELEGYMIKPLNFDPLKQYPLLMTQYSGPGSQMVADKWGVNWEWALADAGYIVACVDGRGTGFRGAEFKKCTYKNLGQIELNDQTEAAKQLGALHYIDASRIGIFGWSYGGFMSLNCILKSADVFKLAISIAPVTSWRYYDTIYTEIYNGLPQDNPQGYDDNSPIFFADKLRGKLLIAHGTADDNVHVQNSYDMIARLLAADKQFDMCIFPDKNHSMAPGGRDIIFRRCIEFVTANL